jgi:hypothetical protein
MKENNNMEHEPRKRKGKKIQKRRTKHNNSVIIIKQNKIN